MRLQVLVLLLLTGVALAQPRVSADWQPGTTARGEQMRLLLGADPLHRDLPAYINRTYRLPRDLPIVYQEHPKINAWYSPAEHRITVSYNLVAFLLDFFRRSGVPNPEQQTRATLDFILLHELGHALMHELDLPAVGREEDAADEFATLVGLDALPDHGVGQSLAAANWFRLMGSSEVRLSELEFWDEHSMNSQRFYKILCFLYGSNPSELGPIISPLVPYTRLRLAQERYPQKVARWRRLLAAHQVTPGSYQLQTVAPEPSRPRSLTLVKAEGKLLPIAELTRRGNFAQMVNLLQATFQLPKNLTVVYKKVELQRNAFLPHAGQILLSQDFFDDAEARLSRRYSADQTAETMAALEKFSVLQEFAFALIADADLAITGEPEDAAAELAMVLVASEPSLRPLGLPLTRWYETLAAENINVLQLKYWSESALDQQRFYDMLGYLYVADPTSYASVASQIPKKRLDKTAWEYQQKKRNWGRLLKPFWRS
ncbi:MAG: hypothetical protein KC910_15730 [Candidatus Eremiobacteraeota bacterium]|nr:hypothetical protein [Candidatus Eremiobacteraeota bacterium]